MNANSKNNKTWIGDGPKKGSHNTCVDKTSETKKVRQNQPKAYTDGVQDFYGRDFIVTPDVLIPRPETEQIIDAVLNLAGKPYLPGVRPSQKKLPDNPSIIDIGTGSGCIAITIKKELEDAEVYASDISDKALKIAQKNAEKHGAPIHTIVSHLLKNVNFTPDVIVANLPYVDKEWNWLDRHALSYEPSIALYADNHGLALIYQLIDELPQKTKFLVLEADPSEHSAIIAHAKNHGLNLIETRGFALVFENYG